ILLILLGFQTARLLFLLANLLLVLLLLFRLLLPDSATNSLCLKANSPCSDHEVRLAKEEETESADGEAREAEEEEACVDGEAHLREVFKKHFRLFSVCYRK
ncbi:hypothetical protein CSUI_002308, partial [Cystoisospora suis]